MKTLYLLRHAKSSWDNPELKDFERPLNERGLRDAPAMGKRFAEAGKALGCIITSPAMRAKTTAKLFAEAIGFPVVDIASNPELYFAGTGMFLKAASLLDDDCESAMLVGHNPAITDFANLMANADIDNISTAGLVSLQLPLDSWSDIEAGSARLEEFDYPKKSC